MGLLICSIILLLTQMIDWFPFNHAAVYANMSHSILSE